MMGVGAWLLVLPVGCVFVLRILYE